MNWQTWSSDQSRCGTCISLCLLPFLPLSLPPSNSFIPPSLPLSFPPSLLPSLPPSLLSFLSPSLPPSAELPGGLRGNADRRIWRGSAKRDGLEEGRTHREDQQRVLTDYYCRVPGILTLPCFLVKPGSEEYIVPRGCCLTLYRP